MSVYVDRASHTFGRMLMCHMIADSRDELFAMADRIGISLRWLQHPSTPMEHFDVCQAKRALAVKAGAIQVTGRGLMEVVRRKREEARDRCAKPGCGWHRGASIHGDSGCGDHAFVEPGAPAPVRDANEYPTETPPR